MTMSGPKQAARGALFYVVSIDRFVDMSRGALIFLFSGDIPTPRSSAICLREGPRASGIRTAFL